LYKEFTSYIDDILSYFQGSRSQTPRIYAPDVNDNDDADDDDDDDES